MLFISPHPSYQLVGIIQEEPVYHPQTGKYLKTNPGVDAEFFHGGAPSWAIEQALENQSFHAAWGGLPDEQPRHAMIASYDTDVQAEQKGWDSATKDFVEQFLLSHVDNGVRYVVAEPPSVRMEEPWRNYDQTHHKQVAVVAATLDPETQRYALEYERAHGNRPSVVEKLEALVGVEEIVAA